MAEYYDNSDTAQRFQPGTTVRADEVDAKFDAVASGFSGVGGDVARSLKLVADGSDHVVSASATERRNKVVGFDSAGSMSLLDGFTWRGDYADATEYFVNDVFRDPSTKNLYVVDTRHTSTATIDTAKTSLAINIVDVENAKAAAQASETAAAASESAAATSETNTAASESAAATSESNAATSETNAAASESAAATSETNSAASESAAASSATLATDSANAASTSESNAATSESNAATSETNAGDSASAAATSETNAASSASAASTSETNAANSETAAQTAATDAETALDNFTDQYLGVKSSDPSTDNDGDPLVEGVIYWNSTDSNLRIYDGAGWTDAAFNADGLVVSFNGRDGSVTLSSTDVVNALGFTPEDAASAYDSAAFDTDFGGKDTDALSEGLSNLYYTDARVRAALAASGDLSYDSATGVFSVTVPSGYDSTDFNTDFGNKTTDDLTEGTTNKYYNSTTAANDAPVQSVFGRTGAVTADASDVGALPAGSQSATIPSGTEAERPSAPEVGMIRFNTDIQAFEGYTGTRWGPVTLDPVDPTTLNIGDPYAGGFFVGIIDTVAGTIDSQDDYQTGLRYALVVSPKDYEGGRDSTPASGLTTGDLMWDSQNRTGQSGSFTRWDGLSSTDSILAKSDSSYEVFNFISEVRSQYPAPTISGGSDWYLPAMDEMELMYRNLNPNTADNDTGNNTYTFPGSQDYGVNPSSDPTATAYTTSDPSQTSVTAFQMGGSEAIDLQYYWTSTDADEGGRAWGQGFTYSGFEGYQVASTKDTTIFSVRPVRRVVL